MSDILISAICIIIWIIIFGLLHFASIPLVRYLLLVRSGKCKGISQAVDELVTDANKKQKVSNLRRLLRSQIYCAASCVVGLYLFITEFRDLPRAFFIQWGVLQQVAYSAAVAHWLVSVLEDNLAGTEIISQVKAWPSGPPPSAQVQVHSLDHTRLRTSTSNELTSRKGVEAAPNYTVDIERERQGLFAFLYIGLMSHHVCALFPFCWSLVTHELGGLCLFGLLYELPVLLLNLRDMLVSFEGVLFRKFQWKKGYVVRVWVLFQALWQATRTVSCLLYFISLGVWKHHIHELLSPPSRVVYHICGCLFSWVNFVLLCTVLPMYLVEDLKRCTCNSLQGNDGAATHIATLTNKSTVNAEL